MIVNKNINPERDLYYLGAKVIQVLSLSEYDEFNYFDLFVEVNNLNKLSINLYILVLDWLFLTGVVQKSNNGLIKKCF
jgi:hypothetical protein